MLPRPDVGALRVFLQGAVGVLTGVDQRDIAVVGLGFLVQQGEDAVRTGQAHDDHVDLVGHLADGAGKLLGHVQEGHDNTDAECHAGNAEVGRAVQQQGAAHQRDNHIHNIADVCQQRHQDIRIAVGLFRVAKQLVVDLIEILFGAFLMAEDLDDLLAVHHFLHKALGAGDGFLLLEEVAGGMAADVAGDEKHDDDARNDDQGQPNAVIHHDAENGQQRNRGDQGLREALADHLAQRIDIVGVVTHDIAVVMGIEIADGKVLHMVKHLFTQLGQGSLGDRSHHLGVQYTGNQADDIHGNQNCQQAENTARSRSPVAGLEGILHNGDDVLHKDGRHGADDCVDNNADQRERQHHWEKAEDGADQAAEHALWRAAAPCSAGVIGHPSHLLLCSANDRCLGKPHWLPSVPHGCR